MVSGFNFVCLGLRESCGKKAPLLVFGERSNLHYSLIKINVNGKRMKPVGKDAHISCE
jgi:hypothetical protein